MPSLKRQELKVVLDTNVWVSAFLWGGKPATIIQAAEDGQVSILISEDIVAEINEVLAYPKLEKIYRPQLRREDLIEQTLKIAKFVKAPNKIQIIQAHPADNKFLDCALASNADFIVSGDRHLLEVVSYKKTTIVTVNDFLKLIIC
jgi:putative PIN family toxin of toxin-antitoxin system